jgi:hypothetical protein
MGLRVAEVVLFGRNIDTVTRLVVSKATQFIYLFVFRKYKERDEAREIEEARKAGELLHDGPLSAAEQVCLNDHASTLLKCA